MTDLPELKLLTNQEWAWMYIVFAQIGTADNGCRGDIPVRIDACKVVAEELGGFRIINRSVHLTVQGIEYFVVFIANLR